MVAPRTHDGDADLLRKAANSIGSTIAAAMAGGKSAAVVSIWGVRR